MKRDMMTARFKRDYVAALAVFLFIFVVATEIAIAIWVPLLMHKQDLWVEDMARQQVQSLFDKQRRDLRVVIRDSRDNAVIGEAKMLLEQLDLLAIYLVVDDQAKKLNTEQVMKLRDVLHQVVFHVGRLQNGRAVTLPLKLDTGVFIKTLAGGK